MEIMEYHEKMVKKKDQKEKVILYIVFITERSGDPAEGVENLSLKGIFVKKLLSSN